MTQKATSASTRQPTAATEATDTLQCEDRNRVRWLRIHRPQRKNALDQALYSALAAALEAAAAEAEVRCVVLTGSDGSFCAGNDIDDFLNNPSEGEDSPVLQFMRALATFPKPVVAAIDGPAVGIGATMLLHCDLILASPAARFAFPFVNLGLCPEYASSYLLPRFMGPARAAELVLLGEPFDADKAERYGLINAVVAAETLAARAGELAERLAAKPPAALRTSKALLRRWPQETVLQAIRDEAALFMPMQRAPEAREAFSAFLEKRRPDFSGFR